VNIESGVNGIGMCAFYQCGNLQNVTISGTVTSIENFAFANCGIVENFKLLNGATDLEFKTSGFGYNFAHFSNTYIKTLDLDRNITFYNGTMQGTYGPFEAQTALTSLEILPHVLRIPNYCFYGCSALQDLVIPNTVFEIGRYAFYGCGNIESIVIGTEINTIKEYTFYGCSKLSNITIPKKVNLIENFAFANCGVLEKFTIVADGSTLNFDVGGYGYYSTFIQFVSLFRKTQ